MFERGQDIKETLSLGKFSTISRKIKDAIDQIMNGTLHVKWTNASSIYQVEPAEIEFKNAPDSGGGNVNKLYTRIVLNDFRNYSAVKEQIKSYRYHLNNIAKEEAAKIISVNFYIGKKYFSKAGFEFKNNSILVEVNYAKF